MDTAATVRICASCQAIAPSAAVFCPKCGRSLSLSEPAISLGRQAALYLVAFLLPPLGLWPGLRYLRRPDDQARRVGAVCLLLTAISVFATLALTASLFASLTGPIAGQSSFPDASQYTGILRQYQQILSPQ